MELSEYVKAGKIAAKVRENVKKLDLVGKNYLEICEYVEKSIIENGGNVAFPCNICVNDIAAHNTAMINDINLVNEGDIIKLDIGVHLNGYIADTAVTISYNPSYDNLIQATEETLLKAISSVKENFETGQIGNIIELEAKKRGYTPISNLSGHSIEQYKIHAGQSIPNVYSPGSSYIKKNEIYAIEPFFTTLQGSGFVKNVNTENIFSLVTLKKTKDKNLDDFIQLIWKKYRTLPFTYRYFLDHYFDKEILSLIGSLIKKKIIRSYPVLVEENKNVVAQAEHTITLTDNGIQILTAI